MHLHDLVLFSGVFFSLNLQLLNGAVLPQGHNFDQSDLEHDQSLGQSWHNTDKIHPQNRPRRSHKDNSYIRFGKRQDEAADPMQEQPHVSKIINCVTILIYSGSILLNSLYSPLCHCRNNGLRVPTFASESGSG